MEAYQSLLEYLKPNFCKRKRSRSPRRSQTFIKIPRNPTSTPQSSAIVISSSSHLPTSAKHLVRSLSNKKSLKSLTETLSTLQEMQSKAQSQFEVLTKDHFKPQYFNGSRPLMRGLELFIDSHNISVPVEDIKSLWHKLSQKQDSEYFSQVKEFRLTYRDVKTLKTGTWLNDEIINAYIRLIPAKSDVHIFTTYLFQYIEMMSQSSWDSLKLSRILMKSGLPDLSEKNYVLIPANINKTHWIIVAINNVDCTIEYYDSLGTRNMEKICEIFERFLIEMGIGPYDWEAVDVPRQQNSSDCGVFALKIIQALATNTNFLFSADEMKYYRRMILYELKEGKIY